MATSNNKHTTLAQLEMLANRTKTELYALDSKIQSYGYQTADEVQNAINAKVASAYRPGGTIAGSALVEDLLIAENEGKVYNLSTEFTTDENFVEDAGKTYPAGTDVGVIDVGDSTYKFNVMAGFVDLSGYTPTSDLGDLAMKDEVTENDLDDSLKEKVNAASEGNHAHLNKEVLDGISEEKVSAWDDKADKTEATTDTAGLMSASDKEKLDGIETAEDSEVEEMLNEVFDFADDEEEDDEDEEENG